MDPLHRWHASGTIVYYSRARRNFLYRADQASYSIHYQCYNDLQQRIVV